MYSIVCSKWSWRETVVGIEGITMYSSLHCSLFMMDIFSPFPLNIMCKCTFIIHYVLALFIQLMLSSIWQWLLSLWWPLPSIRFKLITWPKPGMNDDEPVSVNMQDFLFVNRILLALYTCILQFFMKVGSTLCTWFFLWMYFWIAGDWAVVFHLAARAPFLCYMHACVPFVK